MRIVIKVGTSTLAYPSGKMNIRRVENLCKIISDLKNAGNKVVLVSSGAIGMGMAKLGFSERPKDMPGKQAAAAVGQCELMYAYDKMFSEYGHTVAQILITRDDVENEERRGRFKDTVFRLLELGALSVINENDTVSTDEITVGDNDTLAAIAAVSVDAELLIILSDVDGLYTSNPKTDGSAELIKTVETIDGNIIALAGGTGSSLGTGGMATKIKAAQICTSAGIDMMIMNGASPELLYDAVEGKCAGTTFKGVK